MWNEKKPGLLGLLGEYLQRHWRPALVFACFAGVFALVFSLYSLPVEAVAYATVLCCALGLFLWALGFWGYVKKRRQLHQLSQSITQTAPELPLPWDGLETQYQALLGQLQRQTYLQMARAQGEKRDILEYYTTWAHQIKTPIAAMHLLLRGDKSALASQLAGELLQVEQYVEMVLCYLRLGSESSDFVLAPCQLEPILRRAVRRFAPQFIRKKLSVEFGPVDLQVTSDEKWLQFCVEQLLSNAIKYTTQGGVTLRVEGSRLIIADTGMGIAPEDLPRIFEKGFTGYNGRTEQKATGIGLYLCRRILSRLGHGISIVSTLGQGTQVTVDLTQENRVHE